MCSGIKTRVGEIKLGNGTWITDKCEKTDKGHVMRGPVSYEREFKQQKLQFEAKRLKFVTPSKECMKSMPWQRMQMDTF